MDYPAAHSMDTTWFAVDADGHVGRFDSHEEGAVPLDAASEVEPLLYAALVARLFAERDVGLPSTVDDLPRNVVFAVRADAIGAMAAGASSTAESLIPAASLVILRDAAPRVCATTRPIAPALIRELVNHPSVRSLVTDEWVFEHAKEDLGLFAFEHDGALESSSPGAYVRALEPTRPVQLAELPSQVQQELSGLKLPLHFDRESRLHLADHLTDEQAVCWGNLSLQGEPRPAPPPLLERKRARGLLVVGSILVALILAWLLLRR